MVFVRLRKLLRLIRRIFKRLRDEMRSFTRSTREIILHLIHRGIQMLQLKYNCLQVRKRMCKVRSYAEWESYARLLDHLEGTADWKYVFESKNYDYVRLEARRQMMK